MYGLTDADLEDLSELLIDEVTYLHLTPYYLREAFSTGKRHSLRGTLHRIVDRSTSLEAKFSELGLTEDKLWLEQHLRWSHYFLQVRLRDWAIF